MGTQARGASSLLRAVAAVATAALSTGLIVATAGPAAAVATCGGLIANGLSIDATHATTFFTDLGKGLDASYVGYKVTNSGSARSNVWVKLSGFTGGSVTLADATDDQRQIVSLPSGQSGTSFFFVRASATAATAQSHTVTVYDRRPDLVGATSLASCQFSFGAVSDTTEASANKVTSVTAAPLSLAIGQTVTVTVDGQTGTVGSGMMWMSPAAKSAWPTKSLRLESTHLEVDKDGNGSSDETYDQTLTVPAAIASTYTSSTKYRASYVFRLTKATATNPTVQPVSQIYSGGQYKHSPLDSATTLSSSSVASGVVLSKTMTAADLSSLPTTTSPNGVAGATRYVEVPFRVRATAVGGSAVIDEIVDVPASGVIFKQGSARLTDSTPYTSAVISDPVTAPGDSGVRAGALHFTGPFYASVATPASIDYVVYVPVTAGTYSNQGFATINGVTIGSTPTTVPIVNVTTNGTGVTGTTTTTTGAGTSAQTITFAQPSAMTLLGGTQASSPTASSGLAVSLASDTTSVCTVSGTTITAVSSGTCSITATQSGDATYAAATPVTRTFTVSKAAQTITFAQPSAMTLLGGTQATSPTASSGLAVSLASDTTSVCTVSGSTITAVSSGTCSITATQAGSATYAAATPVTRTFAVSKASQTISFAALSDVTLGAVASDLVASATSGLDVAFSTTTPLVCSVSGSSVTATAGGTCTVVADQPGDETYAAASPVSRSFTVILPGSTAQTLSFEQPGDLVVAGHESLTASATSGLPVRLTSGTPDVCTVSGTTVTAVGVGECEITATQAGNLTYAAAEPVTRTLSVTKAAQHLTFAPATSMLMTDSPVTLSAVASSGLAPAYASTTPEACTVSGSTLTLVGAGTCTVVATQPGDDDWSAAAPVSVDITVARVPQTVSFAQPAAMHLLDADQLLEASASSGLEVVLSSLSPEVCSVVDGAVRALASGVCDLRAAQDGDAVHLPAYADVSLLVSPAVQSVDLPAVDDLALPDGSALLGATATSGLPVAYRSLTTEVCTVADGAVTAVAEGTCQVEASQAGDATYAAAEPVVIDIAVVRVAQTITWSLPAAAVVTDAPLALDGTSDSGLALTYTSATPGICTVVDGSLHLLAVGRCEVTATQAGDDVHLAATPVTEFVDVAIAGQTITADRPADLVVTDEPQTLHATATSGLAVTWISDTPTVCVVDGASVAPIAAGTCTLSATQAGDAIYAAAEPVSVSLDIARAPQTITIAAAEPVLATDADLAIDASASSGLGVELASTTPEVCTVVEGRVHLLIAGTCTVTATQAGSDYWLAAEPVSLDILVGLAPQAITLDAPAELVVTEGAQDYTATADSGLDVTVSTTTPDVCEVVEGTVRPVATGTCRLVASRTATAVYAAALDATADIEIVRGTQTIDFGQPADMTATDDDTALVATATSGLEVAFAAGPASVCTIVDGALHLVGSGTCTITASQTGDERWAAVTDVARSIDVAPAAQTITFEPAALALMTSSEIPLGATADSGLDVVVTSTTPDTCEVVDGALVPVAAGTCRLVATQPGDDRYAAATAVVRDVFVARAAQTIAFDLRVGAVLADSPIALDATSDSHLLVAIASGTPSVCRVVDGALVLLTTGDCVVTASQAGDARWLPAEPVSRTIAVRTLDQTITVEPLADVDADEGPVAVVATSTSGLAVALESETPDVCRIEDGAVVLLARGTCTVVATQAGSATVAPAEPMRVGFTIRSLPQSVHVDAITDLVLGDAAPHVSASATSGLDVALAVLTGDICSIEGAVVTPLEVGTCTITVDQAGNGVYDPAEQASVSFDVLAPLAASEPEIGQLDLETTVDTVVPVEGGVGPYTFAVSAGELPEGIELDPATGALTGTAVTPGAYEVTVLVTDADGRTAEVVLVLRVMGGAPVAQLPALEDAALTMVAGSTTTTTLPDVPGGTTWETVSDTASLVVTDLGDGTLRLAAATSLSGVRQVALTATLGAQQQSAAIVVTVVPRAPASSSYTPGDGVTTVVRWTASATRSVVAYRVYVGSRVVATTTRTTVALTALYGPAQRVRVVAVGAAGTTSSRTASSYAAPSAGRAHVTGTVLFATGSRSLDATARRTLDRFVVLARAGGFSHLSLVGHTDSRGSAKYNYWLSRQRVFAVQGYLASVAPGLRLDQSWRGETTPVAGNGTADGRAHNRRVEVAVW